MSRKELINRVKSIVVKIGTSTITENGILSEKKMSMVVNDISGLIERGYQVVVVSSGAITAGAGIMGKDVAALTIPEKQALASLGQTILMNHYGKLFDLKGFKAGQILLTEDDIMNRRRFLNARHTLETLIAMGIVPVVNENDSVVVKEIKFGDNDTLSAHVASIINADILILLSDIDGFYMDLDDDKPVEEISEITDEIIAHAGGAGSSHGTGGMVTKIRAAEILIRFGEMMIIANGQEEHVLKKIMDGDKIGTIFYGKEKPLSSRKKWLTLNKPGGQLVIDNGAMDAVSKRKKSLLASGITDVKGDFDMGDVVEVVDINENIIGKGVVNYSFSELVRIKGLKSNEIRDMLGSNYFEEVINRDDLVIF